MPETLQFKRTLCIGGNYQGYKFFVGELGERWCGFAVGELDNGGQLLCLFPEIAVDHVLGVTTEREAILMTGAVAQDPESAYGGVAYWFVDEELRGKPEDYRCKICGQICCDAVECQEVIFDNEF